MQAAGYLNRLQVIGSVVRAERAFLERMPDTKELLGVVLQHVGYESAEVAVRVVCRHPGRQADDGQPGDEHARDEYRWAHEAILLSLPRDKKAVSKSLWNQMTLLQQGNQFLGSRPRD